MFNWSEDPECDRPPWHEVVEPEPGLRVPPPWQPVEEGEVYRSAGLKLARKDRFCARREAYLTSLEEAEAETPQKDSLHEPEKPTTRYQPANCPLHGVNQVLSPPDNNIGPELRVTVDGDDLMSSDDYSGPRQPSPAVTLAGVTHTMSTATLSE